MKAAMKKYWRDSASLIVLTNRSAEAISSKRTESSNYDILLQTRPHNASFSNSVVFPGGVAEDADQNELWLRLFGSFGYDQNDFASLHKPGSHVTSIFKENPIRRHISLRITAIRETFEELGLLIGSSEQKNNRTDLWADLVPNVDVKYWQNRVGKNPLDLLNMCKEYNCYPDIWSLHYWSNWLTPTHLPRRFDTAFFITAFKSNVIKLPDMKSQEVVKVEWASPQEILERSRKSEVELYPPQIYEFHRLSHFSELENLMNFAKKRSSYGNELVYGVKVVAKDGRLYLLTGDHLYPSDVNYYESVPIKINKTISELRDPTKILHRIEDNNIQKTLVIQNYKPNNHVDMGNVSIPVVVSVE